MLWLPCLAYGTSFFASDPFPASAITSTNTASCGMHAFILDNSCTSSSNFQVVVSGSSGTQLGTDIILQEVRFIIEHTWDNDLDIWLYSPSGVGVELSTDNGGGANNYGDPSDVTCSNYTSLTMNACISIEEGKAPFIGSFLPEGNFNDFNDSSDPDGTWIFQVCDDAGNDVGYLEYVELVFGEMSCAPPQNLIADSLSDNFVHINWETNNTCVNTIIEYGPAGFIPGNNATAGAGTVVQMACPVAQPFMLTGLDQLTDYDIYIREACPGGGFSQNSCPLSITTNCNTAALTLREDFDSQNTCSTSCGSACPINGTWSNITSDDFDWTVDKDGTGSANTGPDDDVSGGGNYIYLETSGSACRNGNAAILQSQCLLIDAGTGDCHLSFYYHMYGSHINELLLQISTDGGLNWTDLWTMQGDQGASWNRQYLSLSAYHNQVATFRFVGKGGNGIKGDIALDEIEFFGSQPVTDPSIVYYADTDMDGFGNPDDSIFFCSYTAPVGYTDNNLDCDDTNGAISPSAIEITCNDVDENCDGFLEIALPLPLVSDTAVCEGSALTLSINTVATGAYYWFDQAGNFLHEGNTYTTGIITTNSSFQVIDSLVLGCSSPPATINVQAYTRPDITTSDEPAICFADSFDLSTVFVLDANGANGSITFHDNIPTTSAYQLPDPMVSPAMTRTYYIRSTTVNGCFDETSVELIVNPLPTAALDPVEGYIEICSDDVLNVTVDEAGTGTPPMTYLWDNGSTSQQQLLIASSTPMITPYSVTVTDANGCTDEGSILLNTLESVTSVSIDNISHVTFCGGNDGSITLNPVNGDPPFDYQWSGPVSGQANNIGGAFTMDGLTQGAYQITITDDSNLDCDIVIPVIIVNGPGAIIDSVINITDVTCNGQANGALDISVDGTNPTFIWSNGATTEDLNNVVAGTYSVTVMDGACNTFLEGIVIPEPTALQLQVNGSANANCFDSSDGWIDINVNGGLAPYSYDWAHGSTDEDVANLDAGTYGVTVSDANNCEAILNNITISEPADLSITLDNLQDLLCFEQPEGLIEISVEGATMPYTYEWNNGATSQDISGLFAGSYSLTVHDAHDCEFVSADFEVNELPALNAFVTSLTPPTCNQIFDGQISMAAFGGNDPYTYQWSNGETGSSIDNLAPGQYEVTVTDNNNCSLVLQPQELIAPNLLFIDILSFENESCEGIEDGLINIDVNGGAQPYTYQWSNGDGTQNINSLSSGNYVVTITDANGCTAQSDSIELLALEPLGVSIDEHTQVSCAGQEDGAIYISVPPGAGPFNYQWSNGATSQDLTDLTPGIYISTITAADGCTFYTDSIEITEPTLLDISLIAVESPSCNGLFNGNIDISVEGGTAPYFYSWNNGAYTEDLNAASAGNYNLVVLDDNGCITSSGNIELTEPSAVEIAVNQIADIGCVDSIGVIDIQVTGGLGPYAYQWNTGDTLQDIYNITAGYYNVSVLDQNNCLTLLSSIEVEQLADTIDILNAEVNDVSCHGQADGQIQIEIVGGNFPFQYTWSNGVQDSSNVNLSGNNYNVTVTDNYGCVGVSAWIEIVDPPLLTYEVTQITENVCKGEDEGMIAIAASGGVQPLTFEWNTGADTNVIDQLSAGFYTLTITDANGCTSVTIPAVEVEEPASSIQLQLLDIDHVSCFGMTDGGIELTASGGAGGYTYIWNTGETEPLLENLSSGDFQCTVTDANGCETISPIYMVTQPTGPLNVDSIEVQLTQNELCDGQNGAIDITVSGGNEPYNFFWNNGALTEDIEGLYAGAYQCFIIDAQGCTYYTDTFQIIEPINTLYTTAYSTPDTNSLQNGTANVSVEGGQWPFEFEWDSNANSQMDSIATDLPTGWYEVTITDAADCTTVGAVFVDTVTVVTTGLIENFDLGSINYYPNPTEGQLWTSIELREPAPVVVSIVSLMGEELLRQSETLASSQHQFYFDLELLPAAVYFIRFKVDGRFMTSRKLVLTE